MTLNRITITLTSLIAVMFALLLMAALVGAAGPASGATNRGFHDGSGAFVAWRVAPAHPEYARVVYREHHMCDEVHHKAIQSPAVSP
jgi:hypothetical protein